MLPGNMLLVAGNMLPVSRQHVSLCIQQQTGNKLATILPATCCLKQHAAAGHRCSGVNAALGYAIAHWFTTALSSRPLLCDE